MTRGFAIKKGRFQREMKKRGIPDSAALARQIGMNKTTAWRVLNQEAKAGPDFVDNVLEAWGMEFHDLFTSAKPVGRRTKVAA